MKSPQPQQRNLQAPIPASQPAAELQGYESPTYGALAAEISQASTLQGFGLDAAPLQPPATGQDVIQFKVEPGETHFGKSQEYKSAQGKWDPLITAAAATAHDIDQKVGTGHLMALQWQQFAGSDNKRLNLWHKTVSAYIQDPESIKEKVLIMRFGYAVEELVSDVIRDQEINGLKVVLQVGSGNTRPDIVLKKDGEDVAWLDITAEKSVDHIQRKKSSLWTKKPYVAELLYPSLNIDRDIVQGSNDPLVIGYAGLQKSDVAFQKAGVQAEYLALKQEMINFRDSKEYKPLNAKAAKKQAAVAKIRSVLGNFGNPSRIGTQAKGLIKHLGLNPREFGLADGKEEIAAGKAYLRASAHAGVAQKIYAKNKEVLANLKTQLPDDHRIPRYLKTRIDAVNTAADQAMAMTQLPTEDAATFQGRHKKAIDEAIASQRAETQKVMAYLETLPLEEKIKALAKVVKMDGENPTLAWGDDAKLAGIGSKAMLQQQADDRRILLFLQLQEVLAEPSTDWNLGQWKGRYFKLKTIADSKNDVARIKAGIRADFGIDEAVFDLSDLDQGALNDDENAASDALAAPAHSLLPMDDNDGLGMDNLADEQEDEDLAEALMASMDGHHWDEKGTDPISKGAASLPVAATSYALSAPLPSGVSVSGLGASKAVSSTKVGQGGPSGDASIMDAEEEEVD